MSKKQFSNSGGLVYSTNPNVTFEQNSLKEEQTLPVSQQKLKIRLETKHRAGKVVTLVENFVGTLIDREVLGKKLKKSCGSGGSTKDGEIIIQGDNRDKVFQWLLKNGYSNSKKI